MAEAADGPNFSPLEQIRRSEAENTRRIAAARMAAEKMVETARQEAANIILQAREAGKREGQARYAQALTMAEEEAEILITRAKNQSMELSRKGKIRIGPLVDLAINSITGSGGDTG